MILAKKKKNVTNIRNIRMKMDEKKRLVFRPTIRTIRNVNESKEQRITDALESRANQLVFHLTVIEAPPFRRSSSSK